MTTATSQNDNLDPAKNTPSSEQTPIMPAAAPGTRTLLVRAPALWIALSSSLACAYVAAPASLLHRAWPRRAEAPWRVHHRQSAASRPMKCSLQGAAGHAAERAAGVLRDLWFNFECAAENVAHANASPFAEAAELPGLAEPAVAMRHSQLKTELSACPDVEGQTISHWSEDEGSVRWALVEPDLAALQEEEQSVTAACEQLRSSLRSEFCVRSPALCVSPPPPPSLMRKDAHTYRPKGDLRRGVGKAAEAARGAGDEGRCSAQDDRTVPPGAPRSRMHRGGWSGCHSCGKGPGNRRAGGYQGGEGAAATV